MEQENYETPDCCSFLQAFSIKIFECIQNLIQVFTSQNLQGGEGGKLWQISWFSFFPLKVNDFINH